MATSRDVLQNLRNRIDTAETGWLAFAEVATQSYDAALASQKSTLATAKSNVETSRTQLWNVLNALLAAAIGPWGPRLLAPVKQAAGAAHTMIAGKVFWVEDLTAVWTSEALKDFREEGEKLIKDTALGMLKQKGGSVDDAFKPVVDETLIYASRLKEGIEKRALLLKIAMDQIIEAADGWPMPAANALFNSFVRLCPFLTDMPSDTGEEFKKSFAKQAEIGMWAAWAIARDRNYWYWQQQDPGFFGRGYHAQEERRAMAPILDRLIALGVPAGEISTVEYPYAGGWQSRLLDVIKLIEWGKRAPKPKGFRSAPVEHVCRKVDTDFLKLRAPENVCRR